MLCQVEEKGGSEEPRLLLVYLDGEIQLEQDLLNFEHTSLPEGSKFDHH